jgi:hypothetical protein
VGSTDHVWRANRYGGFFFHVSGAARTLLERLIVNLDDRLIGQTKSLMICFKKENVYIYRHLKKKRTFFF